MNQSTLIWGLVGLAVVLANLPFLSQKVFGILSLTAGKSVWVQLLELLALGLLTLACGAAIESSLGQAVSQRWEFFAAFACLFATLSFPGFVWRHLVKHAKTGGNG